MKPKLDHGDMHLLRLVLKDKGTDGWTKVSAMVWPLVVKLPTELVAIRQNEDGSGNAKLTDAGETLVLWS